MRDIINNEYFDWLFGLIRKGAYSKRFSYRKLLERLHSTEFIFLMPRDQNRAEDGIDLRHRFAMSNGYLREYQEVMDALDGPCSVFEMMVALAIRCEESITDDPNIGNRTSEWFWGMIVSLGLGPMMDNSFDRQFVDETIERFLNRDYEPNGKGGLFTINRSKRDLRKAEIWDQLNWYLNSIL